MTQKVKKYKNVQLNKSVLNYQPSYHPNQEIELHQLPPGSPQVPNLSPSLSHPTPEVTPGNVASMNEEVSFSFYFILINSYVNSSTCQLG